MRWLWRFVGDDAGEAKLEFALSALSLLMVIFGTMDIARAGYIFHYVSYAAQRGTRYAMVRGSSWGSTTCSSTTTQACNATSTNVQSYVKSLATTGMNQSDITVTTTWPGTTISGSSTGCTTTNSPGCLVKVKVTYALNYYLPFMPSSTHTYASTSETIIQK